MITKHQPRPLEALNDAPPASQDLKIKTVVERHQHQQPARKLARA
jgi:hypothetical protein